MVSDSAAAETPLPRGGSRTNRPTGRHSFDRGQGAGTAGRLLYETAKARSVCSPPCRAACVSFNRCIVQLGDIRSAVRSSYCKMNSSTASTCATKAPCYGRPITLFVQYMSLLLGLGNCVQSNYFPVVFDCSQCLQLPKIAGFPVKFPVCREFERRQVRSALHRQPAIPVFGQTP